MENKNKPRLFYIDNLRIFLISLVVLHHFAITFGAPGDWYYMESQAGFPEIIPMAMFLSTNQAFFMGMFFFISAYFKYLGQYLDKIFLNRIKQILNSRDIVRTVYMVHFENKSKGISLRAVYFRSD